MDTTFDFTSHVRRLCEDIARRCPSLRHVNMSRIAVCGAQTRSARRTGIWASLTGLRFENGAKVTSRYGTPYRLQTVVGDQGEEMLYILRFYLPRFLDLSFDDALGTVIHELWHVSPACDGDIRRFAGRCRCHGPRQSDYDRQVESICDEYRQQSPPDELLAFLRMNAAELQAAFGRIVTVTLPHPRLVPAARRRGFDVGWPRADGSPAFHFGNGGECRHRARLRSEG